MVLRRYPGALILALLEIHSVSTEDGYTYARDLQIGMKIRTPAGLKPIEKLYNNGLQRIYRVNFSDGGYLEGTADHNLRSSGQKVSLGISR